MAKINGNGDNMLFALSTNYQNNNPQNSLISISFSQYGTPALTKLNSSAVSVVDQIRLTKNGTLLGIEVHYNVATGNQIDCSLESIKLDYSNTLISSYQISNWDVFGSPLSL